MKAKLSLRDRTSFSKFSHRFKTDCISDGITGVEFLSFASAILQQQQTSDKYNCRSSKRHVALST